MKKLDLSVLSVSKQFCHIHITLLLPNLHKCASFGNYGEEFPVLAIFGKYN